MVDFCPLVFFSEHRIPETQSGKVERLAIMHVLFILLRVSYRAYQDQSQVSRPMSLRLRIPLRRTANNHGRHGARRPSGSLLKMIVYVKQPLKNHGLLVGGLEHFSFSIYWE